MKEEPRFITDASLAGLAKWLRFIGYDTDIYQGPVERPMMRQALHQNRILLTRKRDLLNRQFSGFITLVPTVPVPNQLQYIIAKHALEISPARLLRLCLVCNRPLADISKNEVRDRVPAFVWEHRSSFHWCDRCDKVFWKGTHIDRALQFLTENNIVIKTED